MRSKRRRNVESKTASIVMVERNTGLRSTWESERTRIVMKLPVKPKVETMGRKIPSTKVWNLESMTRMLLARGKGKED